MSQNLADKMSQAPAIGLPADTPARPAANSVSYPAVHDMPAERNRVMLTDVEQQKLEADLAVARDRQQGSVGLPKAEPKKNAKPSAPQRVVPVSSSRSIY